MWFETFAPFAGRADIVHAFTLRTDADTRADDYPARVAQHFGYRHHAGAEQIHGNGVAVITAPVERATGADALVTRVTGLPLVIRCADCAPVYVLDPVTPAIGLAHSGRRGTEANIAGAMLAVLQREYATRPADCLALIGPCVGPCHYDVDLWTPLVAQLHATGIAQVHHPRICTACHLDRYYSYRAERGHTGRLFALLALDAERPDSR